MEKARTRIKRITIEVEVPEELELGEEVLARMARAGLEKRLRLLMELDRLIPEPLVDEEEVMEIDRKVKRQLARRLQEWAP